jgi:hypothetical protein
MLAKHLAIALVALWPILLTQAQDCQVPDTWGPYIVSADCNGAPGAVIPDGTTCNLECASPSDQYTPANEATVTCTAGTLGALEFTCTPIAPLETLEVWCGDGTQVYLNGFTYLSVSELVTNA